MRHNMCVGRLAVCTAVLALSAHSIWAAPIPVGPLSTPTQKVTNGLVVARGAGGYQIIADKEGNTDLVLPAPEGGWDFSERASVLVRLKNNSTTPIMVRARAENDGAKGLMDNSRAAVEVLPGEEKTVDLKLVRRPEDPGFPNLKPYYMYYKAMNVRDNTVDPANITNLGITLEHVQAGAKVDILSITVSGDGQKETPKFFPFVDSYGQYVHSNWPGKIYSDADFKIRREEEARERGTWSAPKEWNKYGGWAQGPTVKATGFFYATKHEGKWWLVDPDGKLFWSYGPTGVGFGGDVSPFTERENWFVSMPPETAPFDRFYHNGSGATYMYYEKRSWRGFDMQGANLLRKYGPDFENEVAEVSHERLHSWGFNTIGNWSAPKIYLLHKTPYTVPIHYGGPLIHYRMQDIYYPGWENNVRRSMERERNTTANDPWNIGYFIDNERWWGWRPRAACVGEETLKNPPERHAKIKFVEVLKNKYDTIDKLNAAWNTKHVSWDAMLAFREAPDMKNEAVLRDCGDFGMMWAEKYFSTCRKIVKEIAPNNMYLGSRFHGHVDGAVVALAGKYADVVSYNIYDNPPDGRVNQYRNLDLPIMSTEWGIESDVTQTPFRDEKLTAPTPEQRAREMARYTEHALRLPNMVGAHFFQYRDQPLSGRPDGEATLRGFVNIADTPNFDLIQANRRVAYEMYKTRYESK